MATLPEKREATHPVASFRHEMSRLIDDFFGPDWGLMPVSWGDLGRFPSLDVSETDKSITVIAEVPGVKAGDIDISVQGDMLTVKGEKKEQRDEKKGAVHRVERRYGRFERTVQLPCEAEASKASATFKDGLLTIELPKRPGSQPKRLQIEVK
jgi:HSP20 family protein